MRLRPALILLIFTLAACAPARPLSAEPPSAAVNPALATLVARTLQAPAPTRAPTRAPSRTPSATPPPTLPPTSTFAPTSAPGQPDARLLQGRTHYQLDVDFSYAERYGKVAETIHYTNRSADALPDLRLMVELSAYKDLFSITSLTWEDGRKIENAAWENAQVHIPLEDALPAGGEITLRLTYEFRLPSQSAVAGDRPLPVGYTSRQANLVDWYPFIPPYRSGRGWLAHPPSYYGEHLVYDDADFDVNLRLTDARKDLVVAASAAEQEQSGVRRYHREGARSFALSIGSEYQTASETVGGVTVTSYYFNLVDKPGQQALKTTVEALKLYQEMFGPYPHDTLAVVEADFLDGMEYDGLFFLSRAFYNTYAGTQAEYLVAIAAHETAHEWWYGVVGNDQANEPWLDEALCTYSELLFYEKLHPEAVEWWWYYRINYYHPQGWVDTSVYNPRGTLQTYQDYRNAVYLNGARFFADLRKTIGDDAFFAFLKDYATQYAGQVALGSDFFALLRQHTHADLTDLLHTYFAPAPTATPTPTP